MANTNQHVAQPFQAILASFGKKIQFMPVYRPCPGACGCGTPDGVLCCVCAEAGVRVEQCDGCEREFLTEDLRILPGTKSILMCVSCSKDAGSVDS